ncbi:MAG: hypothetical protein MZV63_01395 [Marinilabiliales bacterium]|nr:hypothetical protein [Marinilabiliales bacterium]
MEQSIRSGQPGVLVTKVIPWNEAQCYDKTVLDHGNRLRYPYHCSADMTCMKEVRTILESGNRAGYREIDVPVPGEKQLGKDLPGASIPSSTTGDSRSRPYR